jgi:hypothetical protein
MKSRRAFIPVGRLIVYVVLIVVVGGGGYVAYQRLHSEAEGDTPIEISTGAPEPAELSRYLAEHHQAAAADKTVFEGKGAMGSATNDPAQLSDCTGNWLGTRKTMDDLFGEGGKPGITFVGARKSAVPGPGPSVQLMFTTGGGTGPDASASLFLKKYMDAPKQDQGNAQSLKGGGYDMLIWHNGGLVFDLVGPPAAVEALGKALGAPAASRGYSGK